MDSLHGHSSESPDDAGKPATGNRVTPASDRRMQLRAYTYWASLLNDNQIPAIDTLDRTNPGDFGPNSILLDLTRGETPDVIHLGDTLAQECGIVPGQTPDWSALPHQTLLARLSGHYRRVLQTRTPIGFEDGFVNQRGATILYRGIVLPFSEHGNAVDFILGVINWKETTDDAPGQSLHAPCDDAQTIPGPCAIPQTSTPLADWADGPAIDTIASEDEAAPLSLTPSASPALAMHGLEKITAEGQEFALIMVQRQPNGTLTVLGEVPHDPALLEEAARRLGR